MLKNSYIYVVPLCILKKKHFYFDQLVNPIFLERTVLLNVTVQLMTPVATSTVCAPQETATTSMVGQDVKNVNS